VLALDASPTAIEHLAGRAAREGLAIRAELADLRTYAPAGEVDALVAIGLLMFFGPATARSQLARWQGHVRPGGIAVINVLIEGTTFHGMFDPAEHYLFKPDELRQAFAGWDIVSEAFDTFAAPGATHKVFATVIARKRAVGGRAA
jgi:tellurite methyltransferase